MTTRRISLPSEELIQKALQIRDIETKFLELFAEGKLNGTVHTSVGQEFSALAFAEALTEKDSVFSNHRCHAHYLAITGDSVGLVAELLGKKSGPCAGIGGSQHLKRGNFYSNGIQGGIVPIAAGMALAGKLRKKDEIAVVFIGDGTLGQGVVYETMNMLALWEIPLLIVCENNGYAQSTKLEDNLAGDIRKRAEAFGIKTFESNTKNVDALFSEAGKSIDFVRSSQLPAFHLVNTVRLNAHSKGDDNRNSEDLRRFWGEDFLATYEDSNPAKFQNFAKKARENTNFAVDSASKSGVLLLEEYLGEEKRETRIPSWNPLDNLDARQVTLLNDFFHRWLGKSPDHIFIGEDVLSPYGGAFKVAENLSIRFPHQVISTPISEAAITGLANGLAISGMKPVVEIMFGDFITLALDQIINHASKIHHMYNRQATCPIVIRTPMGGGRGYGPTHSQTLDRLLIGLDNVTTLALNSLLSPDAIYGPAMEEKNPVIVIENKNDYGRRVGPLSAKNQTMEVSNEIFPTVRSRPIHAEPNLTIVTYGGIARLVLESTEELFRSHDLLCEVLVISRISPIDYTVIQESVRMTRRLVVVEEGGRVAGVGSEIVAALGELLNFPLESLRIGAEPVPIPSVRQLEDAILPSSDRIIQTIGRYFE